MSRYRDYKAIVYALHKGPLSIEEARQALNSLQLTHEELHDFSIAFEDEFAEFRALLR